MIRNPVGEESKRVALLRWNIPDKIVWCRLAAVSRQPVVSCGCL